jgi:hypothetical protein
MSRIRTKAITIVAVLPVLGALAVASSAAAAPPTTPSFQDSAVGSGTHSSYTAFDFNVTGGPSGESPAGFTTADGFGAHFVASSISCMTVSGDTATYAGGLEPNLFGLTDFKVTVVDNGPAGSNLDTLAAEGANAPEDCTTPTFGSLGPISSGDIVVVDSPPPPSRTGQCLNGGYRAYGFANTGLCIAYVHGTSPAARRRVAARKARG